MLVSMTRLEKILWSVLCSAALGSSGCVRSCGQPDDLEEPEPAGAVVKEEPGPAESPDPPAHRPPPPEKVVEEEESELNDVYGPPGM